MVFICKQSFMCKAFLRHKALGCNFVGNREISVYHRTYAEGKNKETVNRPDVISSRKNQLVVQKGREEKQTSRGTFVKPTDMDKMILMWNKNFKSSDEIPEYVNYNQLQMAVHTRRIIMYLWIVSTLTIFLFTVIQCGEKRTKWLLIRIQDEQNRIWTLRQDEVEKRQLLEREEASENV